MSRPPPLKRMPAVLRMFYNGKDAKLKERCRLGDEDVDAYVIHSCLHYLSKRKEAFCSLLSETDCPREDKPWGYRDRLVARELSSLPDSKKVTKLILGRQTIPNPKQRRSKPTKVRKTSPAVKDTNRMRIELPDIDEDVLMAHRYLYYICKTPVISDTEYDSMETSTLEFSSISKESPLRKPGSDNPSDYHERHKCLGLYFAFRYANRK